MATLFINLLFVEFTPHKSLLGALYFDAYKYYFSSYYKHKYYHIRLVYFKMKGVRSSWSVLHCIVMSIVFSASSDE